MISAEIIIQGKISQMLVKNISPIFHTTLFSSTPQTTPSNVSGIPAH